MDHEYYCELPTNNSQLDLKISGWGPCAIKVITNELAKQEKERKRKEKEKEEQQEKMRKDIEIVKKFIEEEQDILKIYIITYINNMVVLAKNINDCANLIMDELGIDVDDYDYLLIKIFKSDKYELKNQDNPSKILFIN